MQSDRAGSIQLHLEPPSILLKLDKKPLRKSIQFSSRFLWVNLSVFNEICLQNEVQNAPKIYELAILFRECFQRGSWGAIGEDFRRFWRAFWSDFRCLWYLLGKTWSRPRAARPETTSIGKNMEIIWLSLVYFSVCLLQSSFFVFTMFFPFHCLTRFTGLGSKSESVF